MRIGILGAGAIGGLMAYRLAAAGHEVSCVARGATLAALRSRGIGLAREGAAPEYIRVRAAEDGAELGRQDLVVLAVKAPALREAAGRLAPLLGPATVVMPAMNGVPWWFSSGLGGPLDGRPLRSVDPDLSISAAIPASRVLGCVVHLGASCPEPGIVRPLPINRLIVGEPSGQATARLALVAWILRGAGFDVEESDRIQSEIWYKLWGNMTMNPLSAITGATMDRILDDPLVSRLCVDAMSEARRIGARIGCPIDQTEEDRMAISRTLGAFKTSMLQDVEAGRAIELDAIVASVKEIGELVGESTPWVDALFGLARLKARVLGLYPQA